MFGISNQVVRRNRHRGGQICGVFYKGDAGVIGHIEPLVRVGRPAVRLLHAVSQVSSRAGSCRPQTEGPVHVYPGARRPGCVANLGNRVECSGVDIARLGANDGRALDVRQFGADHAALAVGGYTQNPVPTQPEHAERLE